MNFDFVTTQRIIFGPGCIKQLPAILQEFSGPCLLVTGGRDEPTELIKSLCPHTQFSVLKIVGEPEVQQIQDAARTTGAACVISIGGGSVIDAGKAISALLTNTEDIYKYLEIIGKGRPLSNTPIPFIAIPTTAGSGAEATRNAVLRDRKHSVKVSLRSPFMLPKVALVDPELTLNLPRQITAATGLDALTQVIEPYVSIKSNPFTDSLCREGITRAAKSLRRAYESPADLEARTDMCLTSLFGGIALANSGLGAVHGFAAPIGGMFDAPHGAVCAVLIAPAFAVNARKLNSPRFNEVARLLMGSPEIQSAIEWLQEITAALQIPKLRQYGIRSEHAAEIVNKAKQASSMKGNPVQLSDEDLHEILAAAL